MNTSIILPTLNAGARLEPLLAALREESVPAVEIVVIDSSSGDGTAEAAREAGCRVEVIPERAFNHGGTRNYGARLAKGEILVFLTQDALPADVFFLERLIAPIRSGQAAAATARQIAYPDASPLEKYARLQNYPDDSFIRGMEDFERMGVMAYFFSNAASAIDREVFEELGGFSEEVIVNEDMHFCARLLHAGYRVAYQADAVVYHSHDYSLVEQFQRNFDIGVFFSQASETLGIIDPGGQGVRFALGQIRYLWQEEARLLIPRSLAESLLKFLGYSLGRWGESVPRWLGKACSRQKPYWDAHRELRSDVIFPGPQN